jgi:hypothetical protein
MEMSWEWGLPGQRRLIVQRLIVLTGETTASR